MTAGAFDDVALAHDLRRHWRDRGATLVAESPLVSIDDRSTLFVTAGIQVLRRRLVERDELVSLQWCLRMRHAHLVGAEPGRLTAFRMATVVLRRPHERESALAAMFRCWEDVAGIAPQQLAFSVTSEHDSTPTDEASAVALERLGIPAERIAFAPHRWAMPFGAHGPCGPNLRVSCLPRAAESSDAQHPASARHFWNLEFLERMRTPSGEIAAAPVACVDSAGSLERLTAIRFGTCDVFEVASLRALDRAVTPTFPAADGSVVRRRVIDHLRTAVLLTVAGVAPASKRHGNVLRRLLRCILAEAELAGEALDLPGMLREAAAALAAVLGEVVVADGESRQVALTRTAADNVAAEQSAFERLLARGRAEYLHMRARADIAAMHELHTRTGLPTNILRAWLAADGQDVDDAQWALLDASHRAESRHWPVSRGWSTSPTPEFITDRQECIEP
jgi:alanyl-tRNA synthetase